jgi:hypothetical protein
MVSCNPGEEYVKKTVSLNAYERFENDTSRKYLELTVLKVYPAKLRCIGSEKYANLYITKLLSGQSLYVFEYCQEVAKYVYDTTGRYVPLIDTANILKNRQDSVIIFVPKDFSIPTGVKVVIADLSFRSES